MMRPEQLADVFSKPISQELLTSGDQLARLAYNAPDGAPRVIPIGFHWTGTAFVVCTAPRAAKVRSLGVNPKVALTIDTNNFPPRVLLVRGTVTAVELVDGIPSEYLDASNKGVVSEEQWAAFEAEVRDLYQQMVRITITPEWAKLQDFETTLPTAVEELIQERARRT